LYSKGLSNDIIYEGYHIKLSSDTLEQVLISSCCAVHTYFNLDLLDSLI